MYGVTDSGTSGTTTRPAASLHNATDCAMTLRIAAASAAAPPDAAAGAAGAFGAAGALAGLPAPAPAAAPELPAAAPALPLAAPVYLKPGVPVHWMLMVGGAGGRYRVLEGFNVSAAKPQCQQQRDARRDG